MTANQLFENWSVKLFSWNRLTFKTTFGTIVVASASIVLRTIFILFQFKFCLMIVHWSYLCEWNEFVILSSFFFPVLPHYPSRSSASKKTTRSTAAWPVSCCLSVPPWTWMEQLFTKPSQLFLLPKWMASAYLPEKSSLSGNN